MAQETLTAALIRAHQFLHKRENMNIMLDWATASPEKMQGYIYQYDASLHFLNYGQTGILAKDIYQNIHTLKETNPTLIFPLITTLLGQDHSANCHKYTHALHEVSRRMKRGERDATIDALLFHRTRAYRPSGEALFVGTLSHMMELFFLNMHDSLQVREGIIEGAVIESASLISNPLWDIIKKPIRDGGLDWVDGWLGFSPTFRQNHGLT